MRRFVPLNSWGSNSSSRPLAFISHRHFREMGISVSIHRFLGLDSSTGVSVGNRFLKKRPNRMACRFPLALRPLSSSRPWVLSRWAWRTKTRVLLKGCSSIVSDGEFSKKYLGPHVFGSAAQDSFFPCSLVGEFTSLCGI